MSDGVLLWYDGELRTAGTPTWPDADRSALYGDGLFETVLVRGGQAVWLTEHLERFQRSARALGFPDAERGARQAREAGRALLGSPRTRGVARGGKGVLRFTWSRGDSSRGYAPPEPAALRLVAHLFPLSADVARRRRGARAIVAHGLVAGSLARHKSTSALVYVEAARLAREADADDALLEDGVRGIAEATAANLFALLPDGLVTPPATLPLLPGLTRAWVIARTAARRPGSVRLPRAVERPLALEELLGAREAFLTNSVVGIAPLLELGGERIGDGRAGLITRELQATLDEEWDRNRPLSGR